jgi:hypothetical protein
MMESALLILPKHASLNLMNSKLHSQNMIEFCTQFTNDRSFESSPFVRRNETRKGKGTWRVGLRTHLQM